MAVVGLVVALSAGAAMAGDLVSYQGQLTASDGSPVPDAQYAVSFALYTDSLAGSMLWQETADVVTRGGLFSHLLGSEQLLPPSLFRDNDPVFLQVTVGGQAIAPRTRLVSAPRAMVAANLRLTDDTGKVFGLTTIDSGGVLELLDRDSVATVSLKAGYSGDSAVVLPDSSISADEMLNEPGIAAATNTSLMDLSTAGMTDLAVLQITIPEDGFIVLQAKCYIVLSGTTGANGAEVQIDEDEGGTALFPYYTRAGMSGFVNTGTNYIPAFVSRTYYKQAGTYQFRLEGMATHPLPAVAQSWDHILVATYYSTAYGYVGGVTTNPGVFPNAVRIDTRKAGHTEGPAILYEVDLRNAQDSSASADKK